MRCKHCDHSLWNQPVPPEGAARVCSECGTPYSASDFDFGRGKVRFCCPACDTGYYGTSPKGHLEPAEFDCVGCGARLTMDRCVIRAHDMEREHEAMQQRELPWLEESSLGWFRRWWRTSILSISNAARLSPLLNRPPMPMRAAWFLLVNSAVCVLTGGAFGLILPMLVGGRVGSVQGGQLMGLLVAGAMLLASVLAMVVISALPALCCSWLTRKGEPIGFARAYELVAYTSGALLISVLPCCGGPLAGLWWAIQVVQAFTGYFEGEPWLTRVVAGVLSLAGFLVAGVVAVMIMLYA